LVDNRCWLRVNAFNLIFNVKNNAGSAVIGVEGDGG
jgi:hypothetical protein